MANDNLYLLVPNVQGCAEKKCRHHFGNNEPSSHLTNCVILLLNSATQFSNSYYDTYNNERLC